MDREIGPEDYSFEPSADSKQRGGRMTRYGIGNGWVFCHPQRAGHIPTGRKREKYPAEVLLGVWCVLLQCQGGVGGLRQTLRIL